MTISRTYPRRPIRTIWRKIIGRFPGFGTVAVNFGAPVSLSGFLATVPGGADAQTAALGRDALRGLR